MHNRDETIILLMIETINKIFLFTSDLKYVLMFSVIDKFPKF